jgi:hypothetical protein
MPGIRSWQIRPVRLSSDLALIFQGYACRFDKAPSMPLRRQSHTVIKANNRGNCANKEKGTPLAIYQYPIWVLAAIKTKKPL